MLPPLVIPVGGTAIGIDVVEPPLRVVRLVVPHQACQPALALLAFAGRLDVPDVLLSALGLGLTCYQ
jgi:hypothetical protein